MSDLELSESYDPNRLLTRAALSFVGVLIIFVCVIIGAQIYKGGEANTESWAALTGLIGWATGVVQMLYSNRFGSTRANSIKDATIAQQAQTVAATTAAANKPDDTPGNPNPPPTNEER